MHTFKNRDICLWPGAAPAPIRVKVNPQVYSVQLLIPARFDPDRSTSGRLEADKSVYDLQERQAHGEMTVNKYNIKLKT